MKKISEGTVAAIILGIFAIAINIVSCGRPTDAKGNEAEVVSLGSANYYSISGVDYWQAGMHYKIFNSAGKGNLYCINITLDSLNYERLIDEKIRLLDEKLSKAGWNRKLPDDKDIITKPPPRYIIIDSVGTLNQN